MADDIISMLPDQVLCHILSFLPIHIAAATSILSKRWTPLWLSVPSLYFDDRSYLLNNNKPCDCFNKFIYKTIVARDAHLPIRMFRLKCRASNFELSDYDLNTWINAATQRGLEDLHIKLPITSTTVLRMSRVFSCKTLVVLKLTGLDVNVFSFVDLPSLKTLHLSQVGFPKPQYLMELLCG
uniref:F-box domain-containing protein n=1 Tax=Lotus japonicus TaxID=34305 RepID=I3SBU3_LOTJA|nr:unknown [Lotus japonicus]